MTDFLALAARVEALTGPPEWHDDVHEQCARAVGWKFVREGHPLGNVWYNPAGQARPLPNFTASLDDAKTLWPGEVPHLIPSDPRICTAMALRARAAMEGRAK